MTREAIGMTVLSSVFSGIAMLWERQFGFLNETLVSPVPASTSALIHVLIPIREKTFSESTFEIKKWNK
jgi:hypothetical protein